MLDISVPIAASRQPDDGLKAIALGIGAGLGSIGAGIGVGFIFGKVIESVTRQPEMREEITTSSGSASRSPRRSCSTPSSSA